MAITSKPTNEPPRLDFSLLLGRIAVMLALVSFGGLAWAINGGFSVLGLERIASMFNTYGRLFWLMMSTWRFATPQLPNMASSQPVIPWLGVLAASMLQIVIVYRKVQRYGIPRWMWIAAFLLSAYDLGTTYFGLDSMPSLAALHSAIKGVLAFFLTFIVEIICGVCIKEVNKWKKVQP